LPATHGLQRVEPVSGAAVPRPQGVQELEPELGAAEPELHELHDV
jgi:hypothetical protein